VHETQSSHWFFLEQVRHSSQTTSPKLLMLEGQLLPHRHQLFDEISSLFIGQEDFRLRRLRLLTMFEKSWILTRLLYNYSAR
jgi:hypothetical protein